MLGGGGGGRIVFTKLALFVDVLLRLTVDPKLHKSVTKVEKILESIENCFLDILKRFFKNQNGGSNMADIIFLKFLNNF